MCTCSWKHYHHIIYTIYIYKNTRLNKQSYIKNYLRLDFEEMYLNMYIFIYVLNRFECEICEIYIIQNITKPRPPRICPCVCVCKKLQKLT